MARKKRVNRGKKEELEAKIFSAFLILILLIIAGLLIFSNWRLAQERKSLAERTSTLGEEVDSLRKRNEQLEEGITESQEQDFWEARIREQGYQKPGETAVVIKSESVQEEEEQAPKNIWEKFMAGIKFWER